MSNYDSTQAGEEYVWLRISLRGMFVIMIAAGGLMAAGIQAYQRYIYRDHYEGVAAARRDWNDHTAVSLIEYSGSSYKIPNQTSKLFEFHFIDLAFDPKSGLEVSTFVPNRTVISDSFRKAYSEEVDRLLDKHGKPTWGYPTPLDPDVFAFINERAHDEKPISNIPLNIKFGMEPTLWKGPVEILDVTSRSEGELSWFRDPALPNILFVRAQGVLVGRDSKTNYLYAIDEQGVTLGVDVLIDPHITPAR